MELDVEAAALAADFFCHRMWGVILHSSVLATEVVIGSLMQALSVNDFVSIFLCISFIPAQISYQVADACRCHV